MNQDKLETIQILTDAFLSLSEDDRPSTKVFAHSILKSVLEPLKISLKHWDHVCADGCCYTDGVELYLNDKKCDNQEAGRDVQDALEFVLTELGYEVEIDENFIF